MAEEKNGFSVSIDGGGTKINLGDGIVTFVGFSVETGNDHVQQHNNDVYVILTIKGIISAGIQGVGISKDETRKLAMWSLDSLNSKIYRKVTIECYPGGDVVRTYTLDKAFCIDYKETFDILNKQDNKNQASNSNANAGDNGEFELKVAQLKASITTVEVHS